VIRIFIGYDKHETVAFHVLSHSLLRNSSEPIEIVPLVKSQLRKFYNRERSTIESTDFSFTRFLVPYLSGFSGWSLFMDCDMLCLADIEELWSLQREEFAVMCIKHEYQPSGGLKFLDQIQTKYEKKNWSSVMLFNNKKCMALSPKVVQSESGLFLHQFKWLIDDAQIGALPKEWNYLVGESAGSITAPKLIHYTLGGPYFDEFFNCEHAELWRDEYDRMIYSMRRK